MDIEQYKQIELQQVSEGTVRSRTSALRNLEEYLSGGEPTVEDVEEWLNELIAKHGRGEIKASTIREYVKAARYYFDKVKGQQGDLDHLTRRLPENDVDHGAYMDEEEWEDLRMSVHNIRNRAFLETMYHYARRPTEVILLNEEDIEWEDGIITFNILKKKKDDRGGMLPLMQLKREGEVYAEHRVYRATFELNEEPRKWLEELDDIKDDRGEQIVFDGEEITVHPMFSANNARMSYDAARHFIKEAAESAGIGKNIIPKSGRHSRATHLNWAGHTPDEIADRQLLHEPDSDVISSYVHPRGEEDVREVMGLDE